ncbi:hypothetical protein ACQPXT_13190 [Streptomyces sp. CA-100214]
MLDFPGLELPDLVPQLLYVRFPDGTVGQLTMTGDVLPDLAEGVEFVTQEVFEQLRARMREQHEARVAEMLDEEERIRRRAYDDLRAAKIPESTARSLSGYDGPA